MAVPQSLVQLSQEVCDYLVHAFANGALTDGGAQYGDAAGCESTDAAAFAAVETVTIQPLIKDFGSAGDLIEIEFALTASIKTSTDAAAKVVYKWQARDYVTGDEDWVNLTTFNSTAVGTTYVEQTRSGYFTVGSSGLSKVPLQVRLILYNGTASSTQALARTKNSSYVKVKYRVV